MIPRYLLNFNLRELSQVESEVVVVGSGIAGLVAALACSRRARVKLLVKGGLADCATREAQGGIAAAVSPLDSPRRHLLDTLAAGAGLCDEEAVRVLTNEGPALVRELWRRGVPFDHQAGELALTREGAHSTDRVLHAGGDATGFHLWQTLVTAVEQDPGIEVWENVVVVDLLTQGGTCLGILGIREDKPLAFLAPVTVLATGGAGRLYPQTSNPASATGDGVAMAYRAGLPVADLEFIQFHPTVFQGRRGCFLVSEALRGEGARLINGKGERFMVGVHDKEELAPRDVVARAIASQVERGQEAWLDCRHWPHGFFADRFPTIHAYLTAEGLNPEAEPIPVAPAAHYLMGGIVVNTWGETGLAGLYACGEVAWTGVHGANRLASNSLLEGLVFGRRVAVAAGNYLAKRQRARPLRSLAYGGNLGVTLTTAKAEAVAELVRLEAGNNLGLAREEKALAATTARLKEVLQVTAVGQPVGREGVEALNLLTVAWLVAVAARERLESRGAHYRVDYPHCRPEWQQHLVLRRDLPLEVVPCA